MHESLFLQLILFFLCLPKFEGNIQTVDRRGPGVLPREDFLNRPMTCSYSAFGVGAENQIVLILWFKVIGIGKLRILTDINMHCTKAL